MSIFLSKNFVMSGILTIFASLFGNESGYKNNKIKRHVQDDKQQRD